MPIHVQCDVCGKEHRVADTSVGKRFHCKGCQTELLVPSPKNGEAKRSNSSKKPVRKERVEADDYDDEEFLDELPTRKSTRRPSRKKRSRASPESVISWAWNLDSIVREAYVALAFILAVLVLGFVERGQIWVSTTFFGMLVGVVLLFKGAIWMWLELFHVNKTLWFLGFVMGPFPGLQQIWALTCMALHFDDLKRPLQEHLIGLGLAVAMPCIWFGLSMLLFP